VAYTDRGRTVARKFSIGGFCVSAEGLGIQKIDKSSTDLPRIMFQFGELGAFLGGPRPPQKTWQWDWVGDKGANLPPWEDKSKI